MTTILGTDTELQSRGATIDVQPPRRAAAGVTGAENTATVLEGVAKILEPFTKVDKAGRVAASLDKRVRDLEADDTLNAYQKAEKKSILLNQARAKVGSDGKALIDATFDAARTKREITPEGQVQFVNVGTGEVVRVSTDTPEGLQIKAMQDATTQIQSVFPSIGDKVDTMLTDQIAENAETVLGKGKIPGVMDQFANVATRIQTVHDRSLRAMGLDQTQQAKFVDYADREYLAAGSDLYRSFYDDTFVQSAKQRGGMKPEDVLELAVLAERDFLDEVSSSGVPNDMTKLRAHLESSRKDLQEFYNTMANKDVNALDRDKKRAEAKVAIQEANFKSNNPDIFKITQLANAAKVAVDLTVSNRELRLQSTAANTGDVDKARINKIIEGQTDMLDSTVNVYQKALGDIKSTKEQVDEIRSGLSNPQTSDDLLLPLDRLRKLLASPNSHLRQEELKGISKGEIKIALAKGVKEGWIKPDKQREWERQLGVAIAENDVKIKSMGESESTWFKRIQDATTEVMHYTGGVVLGRGKIPQAEMTTDGKLKPATDTSSSNPVDRTITVEPLK